MTTTKAEKPSRRKVARKEPASTKGDAKGKLQSADIADIMGLKPMIRKTINTAIGNKN